jgi:hypothetical protein
VTESAAFKIGTMTFFVGGFSMHIGWNWSESSALFRGWIECEVSIVQICRSSKLTIGFSGDEIHKIKYFSIFQIFMLPSLNEELLKRGIMNATRQRRIGHIRTL